MKNRRNYYRILQIQPDAPPEIIHASYRTIMRELKRHPDLGGSNEEASVINEAYATLSDPEGRAAYDNELFERYTRRSYSESRQQVTPVLCPVCRRALSRQPEPGEICSRCRTPLKSVQSFPDEKGHRRSLERTRSSEAMHYYAAWPGEAEEGRMIDFSPKGMRFLGGRELRPKTVLKISSRLFEASGVVTNVSEGVADGKRYYAIGICFLAVIFTDTRGTFLSTTG